MSDYEKLCAEAVEIIEGAKRWKAEFIANNEQFVKRLEAANLSTHEKIALAHKLIDAMKELT